MLSPKMQRSVRCNETQLVVLSERAREDFSLQGALYKRSLDNSRWQERWFILYQNLLFYYDNDAVTRPSGVIFLEGCYCERIIATIKSLVPTQSVVGSPKIQKNERLQYCFAISYRHENQRQYELRATTEVDCQTWIRTINQASFNKLLLQKEDLEKKHVHLLQVVESEKTAIFQYTKQCDDLALELNKLCAEIFALRRKYCHRSSITERASVSVDGDTTNVQNDSVNSPTDETQENIDLRKIKKVQSFFRGWLCRRRWKQIVEEYIKSPHAESMRKRNSLVFSMVEAEEEYMEQLDLLVTCFLRPFKMAASSKRPPCTHEDINSIFLNSETVLFLHQIFFKGLRSRLESWPTLVLGDLFNVLLPMLIIYQEYVRNHHYSLQVLTECKGNTAFANVLKRLEAKPACQGRTLETFLTYPMHQIPRYIITLHELLAHTPHDHVERKSLQTAKQQLEDLSRQMHDEVSETENLRKNLAVERMIIEGCDILLDVNQVFVRQGTLVQLPPNKKKGKLVSFKSEREMIRQCFLFSQHLIVGTRNSYGRIHLLNEVGKISLTDATLIEDPSEVERDDDEHLSSGEGGSNGNAAAANNCNKENGHRDFKIMVDSKAGTKHSLHFVASTVQEKQQWISDISQCIDNINMHSMLSPGLSGSMASHNTLKTDPRLFKDDVDIRFSRTLNSCKLPQVRYATPERLLQRLTDLRFLSIDFLNTFLLTYRVYTDSETVLNALKKVFYDASNEGRDGEQQTDLLDIPTYDGKSSPRRTSGASSVSGYCSEAGDRERSHSCDSTGLRIRRRILQQQSTTEEPLSWIPEGNGQIILQDDFRNDSIDVIDVSLEASLTDRKNSATDIFLNRDNKDVNMNYIPVPSTSGGSSCLDTVIEVKSGSTSPASSNNNTLMGASGTSSTGNIDKIKTADDSQRTSSDISNFFQFNKQPKSPVPERKQFKSKSKAEKDNSNELSSKIMAPPKVTTTNYSDTDSIQQQASTNDLTCSDQSINNINNSAASIVMSSRLQPINNLMNRRPSAGANVIPHAALFLHRHSLQLNSAAETGITKNNPEQSSPQRLLKTSERSRKNLCATPQKEPVSIRRFSDSDEDLNSSLYGTPRGSVAGSSLGTISPRASMQQEALPIRGSPGVVITSYRPSQRRSSTAKSIIAFSSAVSASSNPPDVTSDQKPTPRNESVVSSPATLRVLNVLRHWISKHYQDFEQDEKLRVQTISFLDDITCSPNLLQSEQRNASQLYRLLCREDIHTNILHLRKLLTPPQEPSKENVLTLPALVLAEQMTYLDQQIFMSIRSEEFLGQAWMKTNKKSQAEHIIQMTQRFNNGSRLVSSEIISCANVNERVEVIIKWATVADICRCLHNFNGVLQISAAFTSVAVFRLKKTWDKLPKIVKQNIAKLQSVVASDGRFRMMREALHRVDPPCIPYLGAYLSDLSFIEEGTPDFTQDGLLNFAKMRMIAHVIRELRHYQQTPYKIVHVPKATQYLLDESLLISDDELYTRSLILEPRLSRLSVPNNQLM